LLTPQQAWASILAHTTCLLRPRFPPTRLLVTCWPSPCVRIETCLLPTAQRGTDSRSALRTCDGCPSPFPIVGEVAAGSPAAPVVTDGTCACIFTGANLPPGADTVVKVEDTRSAGAVKSPSSGPIRRAQTSCARGRMRGLAASLSSRAACSALQIAIAAATGRTRPGAHFAGRASRSSSPGANFSPRGLRWARHQERRRQWPHAGGGLPRGGISCGVRLPGLRRSRCP